MTEAHRIEVNGTNIAYRQSDGDGPAAILVHGNSSSSRAFAKQLDGPLGNRYRLIAIDLPGHGESDDAAEPPRDYTLPGYAAVLAEVARSLDLEGAVLVGWSLGGHVVLEAAHLLPDAAGVVIFGAPPIAFPPDMENAFLPHPAMAASFSENLEEREMDAYVNAFFVPGKEDDAPTFREDIRRTDGRARSGLGASIAPDGYVDEVELVATLDRPLAVIHGSEEQLVNGTYIETLRMPTLWRGSIQNIEGAGHAPQWEKPDEFDALLADFLDDTARK